MRISDWSSDVCSSDRVLAFQHADKAAFSTVRGSIGQGHAYQGQQIGHGVALQVQTYIQRDQRLRSRHRTLQAYSSPPDTDLATQRKRLAALPQREYSARLAFTRDFRAVIAAAGFPAYAVTLRIAFFPRIQVGRNLTRSE